MPIQRKKRGGDASELTLEKLVGELKELIDRYTPKKMDQVTSQEPLPVPVTASTQEEKEENTDQKNGFFSFGGAAKKSKKSQKARK